MATSWTRVRRASARLSTEAVRQMEALPWFSSLTAVQRADVGLVVQAGIGAFTDWYKDPSETPDASPDIFSHAPRDLARAVTLKQTVQLIRVTVGVLEDHVPQLAEPGHEQALLEAVLRYSREVAFAAAEVYAAAAEARGAWDARLEAGVVEAIVRDQVGDLSLSRASALGWGQPTWVTTLVAPSPSGPVDELLEGLRAHARHSGLMVLTGEAGGALVVVVGGRGKVETAVRQVSTALPAGPVVVGPSAADLPSAGGSVREALAALGALPAWPAAPRPVAAEALLVERAVLGDATARTRLVDLVHTPLVAAGGDLLDTVSAYLEAGCSFDGAARALFVHTNTVRNRLRKVSELIGLDLQSTREAQAARTALILGRAQPL